MRSAPATASWGFLLTALYFCGAAVTVLFLRTPADVTLFWPAAGIGYALVLRFGLRLAFAIAIAQALLHLLLVPAPLAFLPFSIGSTAIATALACLYVRSRRTWMHLSTEDGLLLLRGALLLCLVSAAIGSAGMIVSGMVPPTELPRVYVQWALGDLLGTTTMTPCVLLLFDWQRHARTPPVHVKTRWHGYAIWWLAMLLALVATMLFSRQSGLYPRAGVILPIVLLLWSAIRYPPLFTAVATMLTSTVLALIMGMGMDHIPRPETLLDTSLLMSTLVVISTIPSLLAAATHERRAAMAALHLRATRDPLTGLFNRTTFEEQARTLLLDHSGPLTLIYVDLDNFKLVNDAASHAAGDEVLRHVAGLVRAEFGEQALHAHSGGDEFMILMPLDSSAASVPGRRLLASIEALRVAWQGSNLRTTASIGLISSVLPHASFDELLSQADTACHAAKELGGNRLFAAGQDADSLDNRNRMMRNALDAREALDQRRFELWCQPVIDLRAATPAQAHFEVLLRWRDGEGQLRPPANLIAAAERFRLGPRLDRYVLNAMLDWLESHPQAVPAIQQCNINLGAATLVDEEFADFMASRLRRSVLRPEQLCLEITETSVVRDLTRTRRFIDRMRGLGCRFALDDFGTGFCSFSYLRDLKVDFLKIDGSFVRDLSQSPLSEAVVRSITEIAHLLDMRAVGEQVETDAQLTLLRGLQVDFGQGYLFQRPIPIDEFFTVPTPKRASA